MGVYTRNESGSKVVNFSVNPNSYYIFDSDRIFIENSTAHVFYIKMDGVDLTLQNGNGDTLAIKSDGLYYNGKKVLTEE